MARGRRTRAKKARGARNSGASHAKRGRKPIFTPEQKRVLNRLINHALKDQLRNFAKAL